MQPGGHAQRAGVHAQRAQCSATLLHRQPVALPPHARPGVALQQLSVDTALRKRKCKRRAADAATDDPHLPGALPWCGRHAGLHATAAAAAALCTCARAAPRAALAVAATPGARAIAAATHGRRCRCH